MSVGVDSGFKKTQHTKIPGCERCLEMIEDIMGRTH